MLLAFYNVLHGKGDLVQNNGFIIWANNVMDVLYFQVDWKGMAENISSNQGDGNSILCKAWHCTFTSEIKDSEINIEGLSKYTIGESNLMM